MPLGHRRSQRNRLADHRRKAIAADVARARAPAAGPAVQPSPSTVKPTTVTVTRRPGRKSEGRLIRIDDFLVTLLTPRACSARSPAKPTIAEGRNPRSAPAAQRTAAKYTDKDIHDVTAYLVTVK